MTRYLFILVGVLALFAGCKSTTSNNADIDATANNDNEGGEINDEIAPDSTDNSLPDIDCVESGGATDCSLIGTCEGDPFSLALCEGDVMHYCAAPSNPCESGSVDRWQDCTASGGHCVIDGPCAAHCEPADDSDAALVEIDDLPDIDEYPDVDCLEIACYDFTVKVSGSVINEEGVPVSGIAVALYDNEVISSPQSLSNEQGIWSIEYIYGDCGGTEERIVDAKVIATDIDGVSNGVYVETVTDFSPWNVKNEEWIPPCADYDVYLEELGVQVLMQRPPYVKIGENSVSVVLPSNHQCMASYCESDDYLETQVDLYRLEGSEWIGVMTRLYTGYDERVVVVDGEEVHLSNGYPCGTMGCDVYSDQKIPTPWVPMREYVSAGMVALETTECGEPVSQVPSYETKTELSGHFAIEFSAENCYGINRLEFDYPPK